MPVVPHPPPGTQVFAARSHTSPVLQSASTRQVPLSMHGPAALQICVSAQAGEQPSWMPPPAPP
ncbi:MAG: hypothetical protein QM820_09210 [Minicystis sp.]